MQPAKRRYLRVPGMGTGTSGPILHWATTSPGVVNVTLRIGSLSKAPKPQDPCGVPSIMWACYLTGAACGSPSHF